MDGEEAPEFHKRGEENVKDCLTPQQRHYWACFGVRIAVFILVVTWALVAPDRFVSDLSGKTLSPLFLVWLMLFLSTVRQFFPSRMKSLGSQKIFLQRCRLTSGGVDRAEIRQANRGALTVLVVWVAANAFFFFLYAHHVVGKRFLVCLAAFYGVCDLICVLVFCPFRAWMMHNRCCTTCRIYDWDYMMMCTPLLSVGGWMAVSACEAAALLFLRWEAAWALHPELFLESGNEALQCANCQEHLCKYRRALNRRFSPALRRECMKKD